VVLLFHPHNLAEDEESQEVRSPRRLDARAESLEESLESPESLDAESKCVSNYKSKSELMIFTFLIHVNTNKKYI
jgi:hypothetical protein